MYIIFVGGGRMSYYLSKTLLSEGHEVLILEKDARKCERITEDLGSICMRGDGCEVNTLIEAGTERADMLIAMTDEDEDNLVACQVARHKFEVPHTISRISNPKNEVIFKKLGVDTVISSTKAILEHIEEHVPTHPLTHLLSLEERELEIVEIKVFSTSPAVGKRVGDISLPSGAILLLVVGEEAPPTTLTDETILRAGDRVLAVLNPEHEKVLRAVLAGR